MTFATAAELDAALFQVLQAPKTGAAIAMLCFRPGFGLREFPQSLTMAAATGIPGERWLAHPWLKLPDGSPDPRIQVSILPLRVLDLVWRDRAATIHPGDPIVADLDMSATNLPVGSLLRAGTAILRVSDAPNYGCVKWKTRYGKPAMDWISAPEHAAMRLRGILCSIEQDGVVGVRDRLIKL